MPLALARIAAYDALRRVSAGEVDLARALAATRARLADDRDRALAAEILSGTLRWRGLIDYLIARYAGRPLERLDPEVVDILRLSAYQVLYLDRVPASAVVHDAVDLTRRAGVASAAGFVNAVLRAFSRDRTQPPLPRWPPADKTAGRAGVRTSQLDYLAVTASHPRWLAGRWLDRWGFEAAVAWTAFNNTPAPLTLRANVLVTSAQALADALAAHGVTVRPARFAPHALTVIEGNPLRTPVAATGALVVQDEASQLEALADGAQPGHRVLDCCAAPGGKTTALAADMNDRGLIVAADVRRRRVSLLAQTIDASRARSVRVVQADLRRSAPFRPVFDRVLVDAPCSGLGTLRRDPDVRWRRLEADLPRLVGAQHQLLTSASATVRPGGRLVYATCSGEIEENEEVVAGFIAAHPEFRVLDLRDAAEWKGDDRFRLLDPEGRLRTLPHLHGLEAFFAAALVRVSL